MAIEINLKYQSNFGFEEYISEFPSEKYRSWELWLETENNF